MNDAKMVNVKIPNFAATLFFNIFFSPFSLNLGSFFGGDAIQKQLFLKLTYKTYYMQFYLSNSFHSPRLGIWKPADPKNLRGIDPRGLTGKTGLGLLRPWP
jgi:hypothetical protein